LNGTYTAVIEMLALTLGVTPLSVADAEGFAIDNGAVSGVFPIGANQTHQYDFQAVVDNRGYCQTNATKTSAHGCPPPSFLAPATPQDPRAFLT